MPRLAEYLADPAARPRVVDDACALLDSEVARTSGVSGMAIRSAYRAVRGVRPGMVRHAVDGLLVPFADQLDPFFQQHVATGQPLAEVLDSQRGDMAEALLAITDERARRTSHAALRTAYGRVRGMAKPHVESAAPGIAGLIRAHTPPG